MSSDGSVSSRISQFGLYRSIDARTEEFLKLSKKRQIRQGCLCAAISTALTVTVVVTTLLIYEYNVIAEAKRSYRTNWLDLMNNSADDPNLLERLNKENIVKDKTTLKLLPILLKALDQNKYAGKILEEPTSLFPTYEQGSTTESTITKNFFADTRNWMKTPHSRLYTIEYKTSPIVYFKNPTRNTEYFTKIRKIRDYQRMLNYVDKMISEKNYLGTTLPMKKDYTYTEKPFIMTTPLRKHKLIQKMGKKPKTFQKSNTPEKLSNCKCSNKLSDIMYKLLSSIEQLLAYFKGSNSKEKIGCKMNKSKDSPIQAKPIKLNKTLNNKSITITKKKYRMNTTVNNFSDQHSTEIPFYKNFLNRHKYTIDLTPTKSFDIRRDHSINTIMNLIKPNFNKRKNVDIKFDSNEVFSTTNSYMKSYDTNDFFKETTSKSNTQNQNNKTTLLISSVADYILQKETDDVTPDIRSSQSTFSETDFSDDDYAETPQTTTNFANNFHIPDTVILELIKSNLVSKRKNDTTRHRPYLFKGVRTNQTSYDNIASMRKMGNLISKDKKNSTVLSKFYRFAPISKQISTTTTVKSPQSSQSTSGYATNTTYTIDFTDKHTITKHKNNTENTTVNDTQFKLHNINNIPYKQETARVRKENNINDTTLQRLEEAIMILNNETFQNHNTNSDDTYQWKLVKLEENTSVKSLIPSSRPSYLEIQRNDWKQEENHDFDSEANNYFFE